MDEDLGSEVLELIERARASDPWIRQRAMADLLMSGWLDRIDEELRNELMQIGTEDGLEGWPL